MYLFIIGTGLLAAGQIGFFIAPVFQRTKNSYVLWWSCAILCTLLQAATIGASVYFDFSINEHLVPPLLMLLWANLLTVGVIVGAILAAAACLTVVLGIGGLLVQGACSLERKATAYVRRVHRSR